MSRRWYLVAITLAVLGSVGAFPFQWSQMRSLDSGLVRVVVAGRARVELQPGRYTLFHEYRSVINGRLYNSNAPGAMTLSIENDAGERVPISSPPSIKYSISGHEGRSFAAFKVDHAGQYTLTARYHGEPGPETVVAIGQGTVGNVFQLTFGTIAIVFIGIGAAIALACVTYVRRREAREAQEGEKGHGINRAGIPIRGVEALVDMIVCCGILWVVALFSGGTGFMDHGPRVGVDISTDRGEIHLSGLPAFAWFVLYLVYFVVCEGLTGATMGKYVTNPRVVRASDGGPIGWGAAVVRNLLRIVDGTILYLIGFIAVSATKKHQRLGDLVAGTVVVQRSTVVAGITTNI